MYDTGRAQARRGPPKSSAKRMRACGVTSRDEGYMIKKKSKHGAIALQARYILEWYAEYIDELFIEAIEEQKITDNEKVDCGRKYGK